MSPYWFKIAFLRNTHQIYENIFESVKAFFSEPIFIFFLLLPDMNKKLVYWLVGLLVFNPLNHILG